MARFEIEIEVDGALHDQLSEGFYFVEAKDHVAAPADPDVAAYMVARVSGLSIKIWADEHPPPHFHVSYQGQDASFSIWTAAGSQVSKGWKDMKAQSASGGKKIQGG